MATSRTYNLMNKMSADIPNGVGISSIPNGSDFGDSQGVQLSGGGEEQGDQQKTPLRDIISDILLAAATNKGPEEISAIAKQAMNAELPQELIGNDDAFKMVIALGRRAGEDQSLPATNPDTGTKEHTLDQLASQIASEAGWNPEELIQEAEERSTMSNAGQDLGALAFTRSAAKNESQGPLKKKKRGNPFKVLMGKVQKLLDHGFGKHEIVRKMKSQGKWDPETVARCVDIVKEYNRRDKRKGKSKDEPKKTEKPNKKSFNLSRSMERTAAERPGFKYEDPAKRESIYDIERDPAMQSTMELLTRMMYLKGASNFNIELSNENNGGIDHEVDKKKTNRQLTAVMAELRRRQYTDDDLSPLVEIASDETKEES
jgi:hypothetical protein